MPPQKIDPDTLKWLFENLPSGMLLLVAIVYFFTYIIMTIIKVIGENRKAAIANTHQINVIREALVPYREIIHTAIMDVKEYEEIVRDTKQLVQSVQDIKTELSKLR